jgi:hypothetical protein
VPPIPPQSHIKGSSGSFATGGQSHSLVSNPTDPTDPTDPTEPTEPTAPTDPTDPHKGQEKRNQNSEAECAVYCAQHK